MRKFLAFWELFIGIGAVCGAAMMFYDPSGVTFGMDAMLPDIQKLSFGTTLFDNLFWCGMALIFVNGVTQFVAYVMLRKHSRYAGLAGMICGVLLMLWIGVQFVIFTLNPMSTAYFIFGAAQSYVGYRYICNERE